MSDESTSIVEGGNALDSQLSKLMECQDIQPGTEPSYQVCKIIYVSHPLGGKMADTPVQEAQSEPREITVQDSPDEVVFEFLKAWEESDADAHIANAMGISRAYGISTLGAGCKQVPSNQPLDMTKIWQQDIFFNVWDPLNTAGSLVMDQVPTASDFNKPPKQISVGGQTFHGSRFKVTMNESPIFIQYTQSAFGFVGRSVYQRALYPLKSFVSSMRADDMIQTKLGVLVAKQKSPGSIIDKAMTKIAGLKRSFLKGARTGQVLSIGVDEDVQTLNMQNVDGAGTYSRNNILKNIATAGDMPAIFLNNETMVGGFGEGTEDAKNVIRFLNKIRKKMKPLYAWFDNIVQHKAWNPEFFARMQALYPEKYKGREYREVFSEWRRNFAAEWPSLMMEPESEKIKVEEVKIEAVIALLQSLIEQLDPDNKMRLVQWAADNIGENKLLFPHALDLDYEALEQYQAIRQAEQDEQRRLLQSGGGEEGDDIEKVGPVATKVAKFDSARAHATTRRLRELVSQLPDRKRVAERVF